MKDLVKKAGLADDFVIASAATSREELGNPVYPPARRILLQHGMDPAGKTARKIEKNDYQNYQYLVGMDAANVSNMKNYFNGDSEEKIFRLLDLAAKPRDIADPWYTGNFEQTWTDVTEGCMAMLEFLKQIKQ
jgi:protein-tyrosine phosphatase